MHLEIHFIQFRTTQGSSKKKMDLMSQRSLGRMGPDALGSGPGSGIYQRRDSSGRDVGGDGGRDGKSGKSGSGRERDRDDAMRMKGEYSSSNRNLIGDSNSNSKGNLLGDSNGTSSAASWQDLSCIGSNNILNGNSGNNSMGNFTNFDGKGGEVKGDNSRRNSVRSVIPLLDLENNGNNSRRSSIRSVPLLPLDEHVGSIISRRSSMRVSAGAPLAALNTDHDDDLDNSDNEDNEEEIQMEHEIGDIVDMDFTLTERSAYSAYSMNTPRRGLEGKGVGVTGGGGGAGVGQV